MKLLLVHSVALEEDSYSQQSCNWSKERLVMMSLFAVLRLMAGQKQSTLPSNLNDQCPGDVRKSKTGGYQLLPSSQIWTTTQELSTCSAGEDYGRPLGIDQALLFHDLYFSTVG